MKRSLRPAPGFGLGCLLLALASASLLAPPSIAAGRGESGPVFPVEILLGTRTSDLETLTALDIDLDGVQGDRARAYVIEEEVEKLTLLGFTVIRIADEAKLAAQGEPSAATEPMPTTYHTYATLTSKLEAIAAAHPDITRLESLGRSVEGRELWMMKITKNPDLEEDEPEVRYIAAMHGDEVVGKEMCVGLIEYLVDNYEVAPRVTALVDTTEIWILPSMNPDGTELHQRYNANGYDLNRDFPDQFTDPQDVAAGRQPETQAVMNWGRAHRTSLSANFHGGALVANYPYDGTASGSAVYSPTPDDGVFVSLSRTYADNNPPMAQSNSDPSFVNGVVNGSDWYVIYGGMQDWNYLWRGDPEITLEISTAKWPSGSTLPGFWSDNLESMLSYFERVHEGVRGVVTDAQTGAPLDASIRVAGTTAATYTDPDAGDYHRLLLPGSYTLEVGATGYVTAILEDVAVPIGPATRRDVALEPLAVNLQHLLERVLDGDGYLSAGESADLAVTLRDLGLSATSVTATLEPTGWLSSVDRADASYPDLPTGGSGESIAPHFGVSASPSVPAGHKLGFAVRWRSEEGSGTTEPFFVPAGAPTCATFASADVPKPILDRQTVRSALSVVPNLEIYEINAYVNVTHPYSGDIRVTLESPSGTPVLLHNRSGGSADNVVGWFDADRTPFDPLSRYDLEDSAGNWTLSILDGVPANSGTLNSWSVEVCGRPFEASTPEMMLRSITKAPGRAVLEWWPYPRLLSYRVYRSTSASTAASFVNVTAEDPNPSDTRFEDASEEPILYWIVTGVGPQGEGPWGHFGQ